ncbi:helix-turn-helix domain-containing protein [Streptosporangium sp. 'caverna']|uniref:helix-turn-helix domain-containing protein n=1 Tax=Streptosporangium sp. 'caverna' TaxID=2202249 RepID=UPI000D7E02C7|nr:helix-turn-helix domain-containing protein [Streptosporangium sp. 'caverna']AWS40276.1 transcriptional regulator [Streptosporangium sp. 'caverna']
MTDDPQSTPEHAKSTRRIDARSLRGLAHPLRVRLLELLKLDGPATSTGLSERLGENTGTVSWHLRHLAEHGFIEEETGRGTKRERWWRVVKQQSVLNTVDFRDNPETRGALSVYLHELVNQQFNRVIDYIGEDWGDEWRNVGTLSAWSDLRMTPAQLKTLNEELTAVVERYLPAPGAEPEPGALPIIVQFQSFPRKERDTR